MTSERSRALLLLWLGAAIGLGLAISSLAEPGTSATHALPAGAVAVVNGELILQADYDAELRRIAASERRTVTARDKQVAVQRLIEDELMIERAIELGMVRGDSPTRRSLLSAMFASERAAAAARTPTPQELEQFYREAAAQLEQAGNRGEPDLPPIQLIRERALRLYQVRAGDRAFAERISAMRKQAAIRVAEPLP